MDLDDGVEYTEKVAEWWKTQRCWCIDMNPELVGSRHSAELCDFRQCLTSLCLLSSAEVVMVLILAARAVSG